MIVKLRYDMGVDGGAIGTHQLRGGRIGYGLVVMRLQLVTLADFAPLGGGGTIQMGWAGNPSALLDLDPDGFAAAPNVVSGFGESRGNAVHFSPLEPWLLTILGAAFTAGEFVLLVETLGT